MLAEPGHAGLLQKRPADALPAAGRLPAMNLPQTFGILTVTLVPTPRLVLAVKAFAQLDS